MGRRTKGSERMKKIRKKESQEEKIIRLKKNSDRKFKAHQMETTDIRENRLLQLKNSDHMRRKKENPEDKEFRLNKIRLRLQNESPEEKRHRLEVIRQRLRDESIEDRDHRLGVIRQRLRDESMEDRDHRLGVIRQRLRDESMEDRDHRLGVIRQRLRDESMEDRDHRLGVIRQRLRDESMEDRDHRLGVIRQRLRDESMEDRDHRLGVIRKRLRDESIEDRDHRLGVKRQRIDTESSDERIARLGQMSDYKRNRINNENLTERIQRLAKKRSDAKRNLADNFSSTVNQFADCPCKICQKMLYPKQRVLLKINEKRNLFPCGMFMSDTVISCNRCSSMIKRNKVPPQAFWNNMAIIPQPPALSNLSEIEQRLLSRIIPFMKIIKMRNRLSQKWCKGQVVLFAQDVVEIAEQLPLNISQAGIVIILEKKDNIEQHKELQIDIGRIKTALQWLLSNNMLYKDVKPNFSDILDIDISQVVRVSDTINIPADGGNIRPNKESYKVIGENVSILRGTFNQGSSRFKSDSAGKQCTAISAVACVAFDLTEPDLWEPSDIDYIVILGDGFYRQCILERSAPDEREVNREYLAATELISEFSFQHHRVKMVPMIDEAIHGHLITDRSEEGFPNIFNGITRFLETFTCGILTANAISVCICRKNNHYWLFDSHARGPKGRKSTTANGVSCCMKFNTTQLLSSVLFNNLRLKNGHEHLLNLYSITPVFVSVLTVDNTIYTAPEPVRSTNIDATSINSNELSNTPCQQPSNTNEGKSVDLHSLALLNEFGEDHAIENTPVPCSCTDSEDPVSNNSNHSNNSTSEQLNISNLNDRLYNARSTDIDVTSNNSNELSNTHSQQHSNTNEGKSVDLHSLALGNEFGDDYAIENTPVPFRCTGPEDPVSNNSNHSNNSTSEQLNTSNLDDRLDNAIAINHTIATQIIYSTSMLHVSDEDILTANSVINVQGDNSLNPQVNINNIQRKTVPPISLDREKRMEELAWYFLYPDGRNGFGEDRNVPITPLDYFQARVMGSDRRFHRVDYLFFALSVVEYYRAKSSVSVSCRFRKGEDTPQGLVDNIHLTMRNIRGSAAYWKRCCAELVAMVRCLGAPTWFATFSCNDLNWPDMIKALLIADNQWETKPEDLSYEERLSLVERYPVVVARQFMLRVNALMAFIKSNDDCFGGQVQDYWYRIEFQNRGSPHLHMLLWCTGIPDFSTEEGIDVINRIVSCSLRGDSAELVNRLQVHRHTETCYKGRSNKSCRFGFPRPVSEKTECLGPDEALANSGRFCILQRSIEEIMINNYNPVLLKLWEANMDIQPCGNVTAVAYYIAKYASKCEPTECGDVIREAVSNAKKDGNDLCKQLFTVSMAILKRRLISAPEAAYRLCHLPLKMCSRKTVFVNSCRPEDRYRLLRFEGDNTSVFDNLFDKYEQRPHDLENISLAEFSTRYESVGSTLWTEDDGDIELQDRDKENRQFITLLNRNRMKVRSKPAILRHRYFTINSDREGFFYNLIVLHIPFRKESDLLEENETAESCFLRRQAELRPLQPGVSAEDFVHAEKIIQQALVQATAFSAIHEEEPNIGPNEPNVGPNGVNVNNPNENPPDVHIVNHPNENPPDVEIDVFVESLVTDMTDEMFINGLKSLNQQQTKFMRLATNYIKTDTALPDNSNTDCDPLRIFVTGGAGSGKSFLLKLLVENIRRCYAPTVDILLKPKFVEVASLTGVAARQIGGTTLHTAFALPIEKGKSVNYLKMSGERLERERRRWRFIRWLVIDEVSMVSYENLRMINLRLQEFKNNDLLFGGINVVLFGDIMQLPPVKGHWCFEQPAWLTGEIHLWREFAFFELTINMRQREDTEFIDLLNNLRFGELTNGQLAILCEKRYVSLSGEFSDGAAVRIFPTLNQVNSYNSRMTELLKGTVRVYTILAVDESREAATYGKKPPNSVIPTDVNNCGGLLHSIELSVGSRVMLRRNLSLSDGLVNGVMGVVKDFKWPALRRDQLEVGELPDAIYVEFDDNSIGHRMKTKEGFVPISPSTVVFQANKGYGDVERRMLPLILSWAVTVHKLQGTTLSRAVIDLGKKNFAKGQIYVSLSRVKNLDGIAISDLDSRKLLINPHDKKALQEMQRLRQRDYSE